MADLGRRAMTRRDAHPQIDGETWAFIEQTEAAFPADGASLSFHEQRSAYDAMCAVFRAPRPAGVTATDGTIAGVATRTYVLGPSSVTVVYMHGGGFVVGGLDSHDDVCAEICARTGYRVVAVDYRLAPEHRHPSAYDDCCAVVRQVAKTATGPIVLAGDSAGGCLAAAVSGTMPAAIAGQVLIYAGLGGDRTTGSYVTQANAPMLTTADLVLYDDLHHGGPVPMRDATARPLARTRFDDLPPTVLITASCDPVRDDSRAYCDRISAVGGRAHWVDEPGIVHGYLRARHSVTRAGASFDRIVAAIHDLGALRWPYG